MAMTSIRNRRMAMLKVVYRTQRYRSRRTMIMSPMKVESKTPAAIKADKKQAIAKPMKQFRDTYARSAYRSLNKKVEMRHKFYVREFRGVRKTIEVESDKLLYRLAAVIYDNIQKLAKKVGVKHEAKVPRRPMKRASK